MYVSIYNMCIYICIYIYRFTYIYIYIYYQRIDGSALEIDGSTDCKCVHACMCINKLYIIYIYIYENMYLYALEYINII